MKFRPPSRSIARRARRQGGHSGGRSASVQRDSLAQQLVGPVAPRPERGLATAAHRDHRAQDEMARAVVVGPGARTPDEERPALARLELDVAHATRSSRKVCPHASRPAADGRSRCPAPCPPPLRSRRPRRRRGGHGGGRPACCDGDLLVDGVGLDVLVEVGDRVLGQAEPPGRDGVCACWAGQLGLVQGEVTHRRRRPGGGAGRAFVIRLLRASTDAGTLQVRPVAGSRPHRRRVSANSSLCCRPRRPAPYSSYWISTSAVLASPARRGIAHECGSASLSW